jgi:ParB family chromosome partitioning protein
VPRPDFRSQASERLAAERTGVSPAIFDLLDAQADADEDDIEIRYIAVNDIEANPEQPRLTFDEGTLEELAASVSIHGVLQPVLVRPLGEGRYQLVAGERRWRASKIAGLEDIPAIVEHIDDEEALEISIIENLQREDLSPLDEAAMYERMTNEHGYSVRKLASKLGKDKGYVENRLRLAHAPEEIRELVSLRKDTLSHAYELLKVDDPRKRKRLAKQVAAGDLSLVKLRERIEGKPVEATVEDAVVAPPERELVAIPIEPETIAVDDVDLDAASEHLSLALEELVSALVTDPALTEASSYERQQFAKYLTIAKIKLENAITVVRVGDSREKLGLRTPEVGDTADRRG